MDAGCPSRIRTSVHGSKVRCPTTRRRGSGPRRRNWSGRRDSNPRPSPWQGDALPTEPLPLEDSAHPMGGAESQDSNWRHRDFQSRALPTELSRPDGQPAVGCPSAGGGYHGPSLGDASTDDGPRPRSPSPARPAPPPRRWSSGGSPVSSRSRLIRSRIGGWVENRPDERASNFLIGFVKYMCWVARLATSRTSWSAAILASARSRPYGLRVSSTRRRVGEVLALAADRELDEPGDDRGEDRQDDRDDEDDRLEPAAAAVAVARATAAAAPEREAQEEVGQERDRRRPDADDQREPDVEVADVRQLVADDALELLAVELLEEAGRDRDRGVLRSRPVAKAFGAVSSMM